MELATELGVGTIPRWVYQLAETGEIVEPYLVEYANRQNANAKGKKTHVVQSEETKKREPDHLPDRIVDHAMAARLQRSFRIMQSKK